MSLNDCTAEQLLHSVLTGEPDNNSAKGKVDLYTAIEAMEMVADDLDVLWQAVQAEEDVIDLSGFIHRICQRARIAAELARRDRDNGTHRTAKKAGLQ
jgi:hypothetical protein